MDTGSDQREELTGGVNRVFRVGGTVVRPMGSYSRAVHHVLAHLERVGFVGVPRLIATDIGLQTETVSFLEGEVADYPLPPTFTSDEAIRSAAVFLRRLHDALATFDIPRGVEWWLPPVEPADIVVHGDFAPYNCVVVDGRVTGVFDFDTAHPAHRRMSPAEWWGLRDAFPGGCQSPGSSSAVTAGSVSRIV